MYSPNDCPQNERGHADQTAHDLCSVSVLLEANHDGAHGDIYGGTRSEEDLVVIVEEEVGRSVGEHMGFAQSFRHGDCGGPVPPGVGDPGIWLLRGAAEIRDGTRRPPSVSYP